MPPPPKQRAPCWHSCSHCASPHSHHHAQQGGLCGLLACLGRRRPPAGANVHILSTERQGDACVPNDPASLEYVSPVQVYALVPASRRATGSAAEPATGAAFLTPEALALDCSQLMLHTSTPMAEEILREGCCTAEGGIAGAMGEGEAAMVSSDGNDGSQPIAAFSSPPGLAAVIVQQQPPPQSLLAAPNGGVDHISGTITAAAAGEAAVLAGAAGVGVAAKAASQLLVVTRPLTDPVRDPLPPRVDHSEPFRLADE